MIVLSDKTENELARMIRADFDQNAGSLDAEKWVRIARDLGFTELEKELKQDIKLIENDF